MVNYVVEKVEVYAVEKTAEFKLSGVGKVTSKVICELNVM